MKTAGKTQALKEWASGWPDLGGYLKLNAINSSTGDASLSTDFTDRAITEYIDGSADREYVFMLKMMCDWSNGFDEINAEAMRLNESWVDWVADQYPDNVPDFGEGKVTGIEPLYSAPALNMVYQEDQTAEYVFQCKIYYRE